MLVDAFPVVDLQSNSEWELTFRSTAQAPIGHMTTWQSGFVSLAALWQSGFSGHPDRETCASWLSDCPHTKAPLHRKLEVGILSYVALARAAFIALSRWFCFQKMCTAHVWTKKQVKKALKSDNASFEKKVKRIIKWGCILSIISQNLNKKKMRDRFFALYTGYHPLSPCTLILVPKTLSPSIHTLSRGWICENMVEWFLSSWKQDTSSIPTDIQHNSWGCPHSIEDCKLCSPSYMVPCLQLHLCLSCSTSVVEWSRWDPGDLKLGMPRSSALSSTISAALDGSGPSMFP